MSEAPLEPKPLPPSEPRWLIIVVPVRQIDAKVEPTGMALEQTRDAINECGGCVVTTETRAEPPVSEGAVHSQRAEAIANEVGPEIDESLSKLAGDWVAESQLWLEKTKTLAGAAAQRAMREVAQQVDRRRHEAELALDRASNAIKALWAKYCPTREEIIKDVIKWTIRATICYAAYQAYGLISS